MAMIALITCVVIAAMTVVFGALAYLMSYLVIYLLGASQDAEMALTSQAVYVIGSILLAVAVGVSIRAAGGSVRWGTGVWVGAAVYLLASVPLAFVGHLWDEPWSDPLGMWLLGSVAKIVKLEHAWRRLDGRNDDGFQVAPFPG